MTIRHKIDSSSPLHHTNDGRAGTLAVTISITAQDMSNGATVFAAITDMNEDPVGANRKDEGIPRLYWDSKFKDQTSFSPTGRDGLAPEICLDMALLLIF